MSRFEVSRQGPPSPPPETAPSLSERLRQLVAARFLRPQVAVTVTGLRPEAVTQEDFVDTLPSCRGR